MLLPLTEDRFELDEFYGLNNYPQTTVIFSDNMLTFNYLAKYWIMNGSILIGTSSTILNEYYENYKDRVVQNGSVVVLEGEIPDGVHVLFMTEDKGRADIVSMMIDDRYSEQRLGISGIHTHDVVGERGRKICWDDFPMTTWKSEQVEPVFANGDMLTDGSPRIIVGRESALQQAIKKRVFDREIIRFGEDIEELGSLEEYTNFLKGDNLDNNCHVIIPNLYSILKQYYRSRIIDEFNEETYRLMLHVELLDAEGVELEKNYQELLEIKNEGLKESYKKTTLRIMRYKEKKNREELEKKVMRFIVDKEMDNHEGYSQLRLMVEESVRDFMAVLRVIYLERGIIVTISLPVSGLKVTRKMRVFQKRINGYPGAVDDLVLSMLRDCLFVFHDLGDLVVTDFSDILFY